MREIIPPLCLVLSLLLFIGAFAALAIESPQPSMELHIARLGDDEAYRERLEQQLEHRRLQRKVLIGSLFGLAAIMAVAAYTLMRPA